MALKYWVLHQDGEEKRTLSPVGQRWAVKPTVRRQDGTRALALCPQDLYS